MGLLYEVYTLPWDSGGFKKKFFWLPVEPGSGTGTIEFLTSSGEGSVTVLLDKLDEAGRDLTEIVSDTTSSLIRVIDCLPDGTRTVIDEWVCERPARVHDDERKVTISGPKLKAKAFDSQVIPAFDSPTNPSENPDHVWGGENILSDPGYENANKQNEEYEIDLDGATGGSFVLHLDGNDTNSIPFDTSVGNLENEVEAFPGVTDVLTDETGSGFRIVFHNPISPEREGLGLLTWTPSLTGTDDNEESLERTTDGQILPSSSWTRSQHADASSDPHKHGTYASDGYRLTEGSEPVRSGDFAGRINGLSQFAGIQQLIRVQPSTRHQAAIWFWSSDSTEEFRLVMRDRYENLIAWQNVTNATPSTWTQVTLDFVTELADGTPVSEMIFRFAQIVDHNPSPFYVDDAELKPGAPITTWGEIVNVLMGLKTTEYDWIDHSTVTDTLDSGGVAWPRDESVTAFFGESYGQFWDKGVDLEYEWDLKPKDTPSGSLTHDLVWYGPGGLDDSPSVGIYPNASITGGDSLTRTPAFNKVIVEGAEGRYIEAEDAASVADIGPLEKHIKDTSLHSDESLTARANGLLTYEAANRNAVHFQMVEHATLPRPGTHFKPGDTIPMQLPPGLEKTNKRVQSFSYTNSFPTQYLVTGSRVLSGEAAAYSLLWRLWRRFENPVREKGGGGFGAGSKGGMMSVSIAAADATDNEKANADFLARGIDDMTLIQQVAEQINYESGGFGGTIWLSSGTFNLGGSTKYLGSGISVKGMGPGATFIQGAPPYSGSGFQIGQKCSIEDLAIVSSGGAIGTGISFQHNWGYVRNVHFGSLSSAIVTQGQGFVVTDCSSFNTPVFINNSSFGADCLIANNGVRSTSGSGGSGTGIGQIICGVRNQIIIGNQMIGSITMPFGSNGGGPFIVGNTFNDFQTTSAWHGPNNAFIDCDAEVNGLVVANNHVKRCPSGVEAYIYLDRANGFVISGNMFAPDITLSQDSARVGIIFGSQVPSYCIIQGNIISSLEIGIGQDGNYSPGQLDILDNTIKPGTIGILISGGDSASYTRVVGNRITRSGEHGIVFKESPQGTTARMVCNDNIVEWAGIGTTGLYDGIRTEGSVRGEIRNNFIRPVNSSTRFGINLSDSGAVEVVVVGNNLGPADDYSGDALNNDGTDTQLTYPDDPTYGDNFVRAAGTAPIIKVINESEEISESDLSDLNKVKIIDENEEISESDLSILNF